MIGPDTLVSSKTQATSVAGRGSAAKDDSRAVGLGGDDGGNRKAFADFVSEKPVRSERGDDRGKGLASGAFRAEAEGATLPVAESAVAADLERVETTTDVQSLPAGQGFLMALATLSIRPAEAGGGDGVEADASGLRAAAQAVSTEQNLGPELAGADDTMLGLDLPSDAIIDPALGQPFDQVITRVPVAQPVGLRDLEIDVAVTGKETHLDPLSTVLSQDIIDVLPKALPSEAEVPLAVSAQPTAVAPAPAVIADVAPSEAVAVAEATKVAVGRVEPEVARGGAKADKSASEPGAAMPHDEGVGVVLAPGLAEGQGETQSDTGSQGDGFDQLIRRVAKDTTEGGAPDGSLQAMFGAGATQRASQTEQAVAAPGVQIAEQVAQDLAAVDVATISTDGVVKVLKIELKPENLGSVSVSISLKDDVISLHIEAQRGETLHAIERERDQLIQSLKQAGYLVDTVSTAVQVDARPSGRVEGASSSQQGSFGSGQSQSQLQGQMDGRGGSSQSRNGEPRPDGQQRSGDSLAPIVNDPQSGLARSRGGAVYV